MQRPVHLRTVQCGTRRIVNRSHYDTDDLVALVVAVEAWVREVADEPPPPDDDAGPLIFVSARGMAEGDRYPTRAELGDEAYSDRFLYRWLRTRGDRMIALTTPHGTDAHPGAAAARARPQGGLSESLVRHVASYVAHALDPNDDTRVRTRAEDVPEPIASLRIRSRRAHGVVVRARVRNGMLRARARVIEEHAHECVLALQDVAFHVHRAGVRLMTHASTTDILRAYHDLLSPISVLAMDLERVRARVRLPARPPRLPPRRLYVTPDEGEEEWRAQDHVQAPTAPLRAPPGPHVSALGTLEIENQTVYATADLLALVNRVEAAAARWQGTDGPPRVARRVQAHTPRGHLPRLSFVHLYWQHPPETDAHLLPLLTPMDRTSVVLPFVPLRRPETRTSDPMRLLACGPPGATRRDLGMLAQRVALAWYGEPRGRDWIDPRGLRLRVARHASTSLRWGGPTARRRAARACEEVRTALATLEGAIAAVLAVETRLHGVLRALHTEDRHWSCDSALLARHDDLETMLQRTESWVGAPSFRA